MPVNDSSEFGYTPGVQKPTHEYGQPYGDEFHAEAVQELLYSVNAGYTQKGVTLAGGQGVLPTGTVLARHAASGLYVMYQLGATDGRQTPIGILRDARDTGYSGGTLVGPNGNLTVAGTTTTYAAGASGKAAAMAQGNLVYRGVLNANLISGTDTVSLVSGTGGGFGTPAMQAMGGRVVQFSTPAVAGGPFPGGPMDGNPNATQGSNVFIF